MSHEHAGDDNRSPRQLAAIALVAFVAFPGTLTALGSGLVVLYASPPTLATPGATALFAALGLCAGGAIVAHQLLNP
ncbi:hypothetical protein [Halorubrum aethiopicum]|uniref:hypothetical protein n=1 Tax=Halorubrum aethiopicum TaxID=1758255 RepID=UPI000834FF61|nr:hypothetical protein [Halorubrum aethiopicum]